MDKIRLRRAGKSDCELLYKWANDREVRKRSFHTEEIKYEEHVEWFQKKMEDTACHIYILLYSEKEAGQIRLDWSGDTAEISYSIASECRGRGLGNEILRLVEAYVAGNTLLGRVKRENQVSGKCFERNGYERVERGEWIEYFKKIEK